jgi:hypothetical protein
MKTNIDVKVFFAIAAALVLYMFSTLPFAAAAKAKCLENGYSESRVAWNYKTYCVNLDGTDSQLAKKFEVSLRTVQRIPEAWVL